ncbi:PSD1 and planctomycete cytochrome C domain-containing protein [Runella salmonicolor]|uniref:PSD1 and planctomycete cytochrome C domain-containing protein n=1 Tax=Runella salmonicolor TaxID=2950278 RepID=A0ABT1FW14_9BACT|nr:PSD1 and planctomycete cytochrome C domain-containing protein [Runella salmonicolor]MCP1385964.1 PSD1 and planctomycete cytochrome C domain-containing protein [Runella salmonicolor]
MKWPNNKVLLSVSALVFVGAWLAISPDNHVDFNTEVKPILNKKCMACHGGVKKAGGFSLLFREEALAKTKSGKPAIIPGDADGSAFIQVLTHSDPEKRMPKKGDPLTDEEVEILRDWVDEGAEWGTHWAYSPVEKQSAPQPSWWDKLFQKIPWGNSDIDRFVFEKQQQQNSDALHPSPEADRATLLRRVTLDLTGLAPTAAQYEKFLNDKSPKAYETVVDSLLASPAFGERWAGMWLDLARYADSRGYEKDDARNIWRYRDWVIKAFNENKPYDKFITEQLAGDLLPNRTENELIATGFHRNTMNNDEGGTDNEEFRTSEVLDRVSTTWEALQGTTFSCVQCHSHPYDPFRHEEYYKFMAFLNNTSDQDVSDEASFLRFFEEKDQKKLDELTEWLKKNTTPQKAEQYTHYVRTLEPRIYFHLFDQYKNGTLEPTAAAMLQNNGSLRLKQAPVRGKRKILLYYRSRQPATVVRISTDSLNGPLVATTKLDTSRSFQIAYIDLPPFSTRKDLHFSFTNAKVKDQKDDIAALMWVAFWAEDFPGKGKPGYEEQYANFQKLLVTSAETMPIMQENPPEYARVTRVFERGSFLSPAAAVAPDVPKSLHAFPKNAPRNRLGLAQWLTSKQNPLTARVAVNRFWEQLFGTGLVETLEDFGSQGFTPTHVELLDYLSYKFMHEYNWQMKPLLKEIVLSATYRQDSRATDAQIAQDPTNRWLARGPRVRLTGEQIRDQALIVSGLLSNKMYGKPVMPYQPQGVWQVVYSGISWKRSEGEDAYRRAIYTFIRRSSPYPSMLTFDGSNRDVCLARRIRTNTPLQALVTLNDSAFVEMSIKFAERMEKEGGKSVPSKLQRGYWLMTGRALPPAKQKVLVNLYAEALRRFEKERGKAVRWIGRESATPNDAALAFVANTMLNMDEFISKQ